jgi:hypothetical protein
MTRNLLKRLAVLGGGLLLFAQLTLPAQACMLWLQPGPMQKAGDAIAMDGCMGTPMDKPACFAHCLKADQRASVNCQQQL